MRAKRLLQTLLEKSCEIHKKRLEILLLAAETLTTCDRLNIAELGRGLINKRTEKNNIKRIDRLVGNDHLHEGSREIYRALAHYLIAPGSKPVILIDWSSATVAERYQFLRAGIAIKGRSITLYEEVHPLSKYNNRQVHKNFLNALLCILPENCKPVIVTDAGFGIPWFKEVSKLGWDFVGRVSSNLCYKLATGAWKAAKALFNYEKSDIKRLGKVSLAKKHSFECFMQVYKSVYKGRKRKNVYGETAARSVTKKCQRSAKKPWVLVHSLGLGVNTAKKVNKIYASRMQIEESFRDIKSPRYGFGLRYSGSLGVKRLSNLLLIGLLGTFIVWLYGICAKKESIHHTFQTNSIKKRNVLSIPFIGRIIAKRYSGFSKAQLLAALQQIQGNLYVC